MKTYEEHTQQIEDALAQARALGADEKSVERLEYMLEAQHQMHPFTVYYNDNRLAIQWELPTANISIIFGPEDDWEWHMVETFGTTTKCTDFRGAPSFVHDGRPYYCIPSEIDKLITINDEFSQPYEPRLKRHEYEIAWVTNRYDGMLAGYLYWNGTLYYCRSVEETTFQCNRMFAVYELTEEQKDNAWGAHHYWMMKRRPRLMRRNYTKCTWEMFFIRTYNKLRYRLFGFPKYDHEKHEKKITETYGNPVAYFER